MNEKQAQSVHLQIKYAVNYTEYNQHECIKRAPNRDIHRNSSWQWEAHPEVYSVTPTQVKTT